MKHLRRLGIPMKLKDLVCTKTPKDHPMYSSHISNSVLFSINPKTAYTYIDDEAVLMGMADETLYGLNAVATEILKHIESRALSLEDITCFLTTNYEIDEACGMEDAKLFIQDMLDKQLIVVTADSTTTR